MQVCYFTGVMRKVDWQRAQKAHCSCNTVSGHIINPRAAKFNTDRLEGKSSGRGARLLWLRRYASGVPQTTEPQMDSPDIFTQTATGTCGDRPTDQRTGEGVEGNDSENMREREKRRKTGSSIFSKARHPAAKTSSSFSVKRMECFVKYGSFAAQKAVAVIDGRGAAQ